MNRLKSLLEKQYGFHVTSIVHGPRQFVAETFILTTSDAKKYFIKVIPPDKFSLHMIEGLPILKELYTLGITYINYPVATTENTYSIISNQHVIIVFNYIDAYQSFVFDVNSFAKKIAQVHEIHKAITETIPKEDFTPEYMEKLTTTLNRVFTVSFQDIVMQRTKQFLTQHKNEIYNHLDKFFKLIKLCKETHFGNVLTHGDAPGNTLVDKKGNIYIVDWDDIKLAPAERDTWFLMDKPEFLEGYQTIFPHYQVNRTAYSFYLYNRFFQDLLDFIEEIESDKPQEHKAENLNGLRHDCFEWLMPLMKRTN